MNLTQQIETIINDYLQNQISIQGIVDDLNRSDLDDVAADIIEVIDSHEMAQFIINQLQENAYHFDQGSFAYQHCESCGKNFGDFVSNIGDSIPADHLLKQGNSILILE